MSHTLQRMIFTPKVFVWILALIGAIAAANGLIAYTTSHSIIQVGDKAHKVVIVPATVGVEAYSVKDFCNDPMTKVTSFLAPDASGVTYQLTRVRDSKPEAVIVVRGIDGETRIAKHYWQTEVGQQSEAAVVTEEAWTCITRRMR